MRRFLLISASIVSFILLAAFTVRDDPEAGVPGGSDPSPLHVGAVSATPGVGGAAIQSCTLRNSPPGDGTTPQGIPVVTAAESRTVGSGAGAPQPEGFRDWIRKIRRFLQWVRSAIDAVLDSTTDGGGNAGPGGTVVNGGLQK